MHINITSSTRKHPHPADMLIDCANLPNPHEVPALRPRDGRAPHGQRLAQYTTRR